MYKTPVFMALIASVAFSAPSFAQDNTAKPAVEMSGKSERGPIDQAKFMNIDALKAADTDNDGILSRSEIEAHVQKKTDKRAADRMARRLDVNKDGKISLEAIVKHRAERFAALDKNKDGKLDRDEMKAGKKHSKRGGHDGKHHSKREHGEHKKHGGDRKAVQPKADKV